MRKLIAILVLPLTCSGCFHSYMYIESDSFRDECHSGGDSCPKRFAIEAIAEVGVAALIAGGAAIAHAVAQADQEESPFDDPEIAAELEAEKEAKEKAERERDEKRRDQSWWP